VHRITSALEDPPPAWVPSGSPDPIRAAAQSSLAGGMAGLALFHLDLHRSHLADGHLERAALCLERAAAAVERQALEASLFSGFTGIAWAIEQAGPTLGSGADDVLENIDDALLDHLRAGGPSQMDLVRGLVGLGVYALERLPRPAAAEILHLVVERLLERAERVPEGLRWRSPPAASGPQAEPLGPYDLGMAHGVPGLVALLAMACLRDVEAGRARELLQGAVSWLRAQRRTFSDGASFSKFAGPGSSDLPARLAWCYGDLGIASALHAAGRAVNEPSWREEALDLAIRAAGRDPERSGVRDAGICHGAAGVSHLFRRLHQATGEPRLAEAARFWLERTLDLQDPASGVGGVRAWDPREGESGAWVRDPGVLGGAAGVGLVLLAALGAAEPEWDRMLLISARSGAAR
jgi:class I lanthipeptide synthase